MNSKRFAKRMKDSAVSPVIATILMVAITVVLAAVLYVMVSGFTHSPGTANSAGLTEASNAANNSTVSIASVSASNIHITDLKIVIGGTSYTVTAPAVSGGTIKLSGSTYTVSFVVISGNSITYLQAGDYFNIAGASGTSLAGTSVTLYDGGSSLGSTTL